MELLPLPVLFDIKFSKENFDTAGLYICKSLPDSPNMTTFFSPSIISVSRYLFGSSGLCL